MSIRQRATGALSLSVLAATLLVAPAAAAPRTLWVDDDGKAGPTGCAGPMNVPVRVQTGINRASAGDTVNVCPGVYAEALLVSRRRVILRSVVPHQAVLVPAVVVMTSGLPEDTPPAITVTKSGDKVIGFFISRTSTTDCSLGGGIVAHAPAGSIQGVEVRGNKIVGRSDALSMSCGLTDGVKFDHADGVIAGNTVRDYIVAGIWIEHANVAATGNTVTWAHPDQDPGFAVSPGGGPSYPAVIATQSAARIVGNHVSVPAGVTPASGGGGLVLMDTNGTVKGNTVTGFDYGITAGYRSRGTITGNVVSKGAAQGIYLYSSTLPPQTKPLYTVTHNRVKGFVGGGMHVGVVGVLVTDNDFTKNLGLDCRDDEVPAKNIWKRNLGNEQNRPGLCKKP